MASLKDTDRWVLSASGMTNIRTMPVTTKTNTKPERKKTSTKRGKRNGR